MTGEFNELIERIKKLDEEAVKLLRETIIAEIEGIARIDVHREARAGKPEAIFAEGKSVDDLLSIVKAYVEKSGRVLVTRLSDAQMEALEQLNQQLNQEQLSQEELNVRINRKARTAVIQLIKSGNVAESRNKSGNKGKVAIMTAGTSDIPVAEEAAETAEFLGLDVLKFYDVGVAGIHRLVEPIRKIAEEEVDAVIVVAGMEGALPSVVAGMVDVPVIAVPTSVGYGVNFGGLTALFAMLQSCSSGVAVVNIDNGFGAAVFASLIARRRSR
jgi:hypothetical protein